VYPFLRVFNGSGSEAMRSMTRLLANKALHRSAPIVAPGKLGR
jgi:hypothetical protein